MCQESLRRQFAPQSETTLEVIFVTNIFIIIAIVAILIIVAAAVTIIL